MDEDSILNDMFSALSHEIRREIVSLIGNQGSTSYTDMKVLNLEPGTLYFHIDVLLKGPNPLVERDQQKRYCLTELGVSAFEMLQHGEDTLYWLKRTSNPRVQVSGIVGMMPAIRRIQSDPWRFTLEMLLFLGAYGYLSYAVGLLPVGLFFIEFATTPMLSIASALIAWIAIYVLIELVSSVIIGTRCCSPSLFMSIPISFIPNVVMELLLNLMVLELSISGWFLTLLLTGTISWSAFILTMCLAKARSVRPLRAGLVTLIVTNANLLLLILLT